MRKRIESRLRRLAQWGLNDVAFRGLSPNTVLGKLHEALPLRQGSEVLSAKQTFPAPRVGSDGLPLPPAELTVGYLHDPADYVRRGGVWAAELKRLAAEHGAAVDADASVLDWGSSSGRVLRHFTPEAKRGAACWGVDIDARAIAWARAHLGESLRFVTGTSFPHLPFPDARFSLIYGLSVMTHLEHLEDTWLLELRRVLRPGGVLVLTIMDGHTLEAYAADRPGWFPEQLRPQDVLAERDHAIIFGAHQGSTFTFHRRDYVERVWGHFFTVLDQRPAWVEGSLQTAVVLGG